MKTASNFVDEMGRLFGRSECAAGRHRRKPLCFAWRSLMGDDGEGAFWYASPPTGPNLLAETAGRYVDAHEAETSDPEDDGFNTLISGLGELSLDLRQVEGFKGNQHETSTRREEAGSAGGRGHQHRRRSRRQQVGDRWCAIAPAETATVPRSLVCRRDVVRCTKDAPLRSRN